MKPDSTTAIGMERNSMNEQLFSVHQLKLPVENLEPEKIDKLNKDSTIKKTTRQRGVSLSALPSGKHKHKSESHTSLPPSNSKSLEFFSLHTPRHQPHSISKHNSRQDKVKDDPPTPREKRSKFSRFFKRDHSIPNTKNETSSITTPSSLPSTQSTSTSNSSTIPVTTNMETLVNAPSPSNNDVIMSSSIENNQINAENTNRNSFYNTRKESGHSSFKADSFSSALSSEALYDCISSSLPLKAEDGSGDIPPRLCGSRTVSNCGTTGGYDTEASGGAYFSCMSDPEDNEEEENDDNNNNNNNKYEDVNRHSPIKIIPSLSIQPSFQTQSSSRKDSSLAKNELVESTPVSNSPLILSSISSSSSSPSSSSYQNIAITKDSQSDLNNNSTESSRNNNNKNRNNLQNYNDTSSDNNTNDKNGSSNNNNNTNNINNTNIASLRPPTYPDPSRNNKKLDNTEAILFTTSPRDHSFSSSAFATPPTLSTSTTPTISASSTPTTPSTLNNTTSSATSTASTPASTFVTPTTSTRLPHQVSIMDMKSNQSVELALQALAAEKNPLGDVDDEEDEEEDDNDNIDRFSQDEERLPEDIGINDDNYSMIRNEQATPDTDHLRKGNTDDIKKEDKERIKDKYDHHHSEETTANTGHSKDGSVQKRSSNDVEEGGLKNYKFLEKMGE